MEEDVKKSTDGSNIRHYGEPNKQFQYALPDDIEGIQKIERHIGQFIGKPITVFHEIASNQVHIDVHVVPPASNRPYYTLVTTGMSDRPMKVPAPAKERAYAELMMCLPAEWPMKLDAYTVNPPKERDDWCWPIGFLRYMARFPHLYDTWLGYGHTMPNGDPPQAFSMQTQFCGVILFPSLIVPQAFWSLPIRPGKTVHFYSLWPLYREELNFKLNQGSNALINRFAQNKVTDLVNIARINTCR